MQESNFNVIIDTENYTTVIGESAKIDVGQAISNVQSGKAEIEAAVQDGKAAFNLNATAKTGEFNNNASAKTQNYNDNAVAKTTAFNDNATAKTSSFDTNATNKTNAFNQNVTDKTLAFNNNAAAKQAEVDASAVLAKQYAIGDPSEPTGNSAKYWAEQASSSVTGLGARVTAIEGKIPADASSSNQLADKSWVESQEYITGITSSDVTNALGYTPYNSTNPNGYTSNVGTVTSVNNTAPDSSGNVTLIIPDSLPSQTGQAGKFLTTNGTDASWADVSTRNIGEIVQSTIPLTDAGLHLLDGALLQGSGAYGDFVTYIAGLVNSYPNLFTTETDWQQSIVDYGVCGKFVYDSTNNTVRLPKITGFTEGIIDATVLGDLVEAGLPNITGSGGFDVNTNENSDYWSGCLQATQFGNQGVGDDGSKTTTFTLDASRSSSIYGNSNTVQPQAIKVLYYIVIATSTKTNIEVDIDEVMTDLNGKADVDLSNVTTSGKSLISGLSMPSNRYTNLTLGASGTEYTAPANGYFFVEKTAGATGKYLSMSNMTSGVAVEVNPTVSTNWPKCWIMAKKDDVVKIAYTLTGATQNFKFIYAEGEPNV